MNKIVSPVLYSIGAPLMEKTKTSVIGGKRIKEHTGKLSKDLGKPAMSASKAELDSYINAAKSPAEKKKRVARVNLMKSHAKGLKAQGKTPGKHKSEGVIQQGSVVMEGRVIARPIPAVVKPKYR